MTLVTLVALVILAFALLRAPRTAGGVVAAPPRAWYAPTAGAPPGRQEPLPEVEPITAYKVATVTIDGDWALGFAGVCGRAYQVEDRSVCTVYGDDALCEDGCPCGFHAVSGIGRLKDTYLGSWLADHNVYLLRVTLTGRVHRYSHGYRAQRQKVDAVLLPARCARAGARGACVPPARLRDRYPPERCQPRELLLARRLQRPLQVLCSYHAETLFDVEVALLCGRGEADALRRVDIEASEAVLGVAVELVDDDFRPHTSPGPRRDASATPPVPRRRPDPVVGYAAARLRVRSDRVSLALEEVEGQLVARRDPKPAVTGAVAQVQLYGRVAVHTRSVRSRDWDVLGVRLPASCPTCGAPAVALSARDGYLDPACAEHLAPATTWRLADLAGALGTECSFQDVGVG